MQTMRTVLAVILPAELLNLLDARFAREMLFSQLPTRVVKIYALMKL